MQNSKGLDAAPLADALARFSEGPPRPADYDPDRLRRHRDERDREHQIAACRELAYRRRREFLDAAGRRYEPGLSVFEFYGSAADQKRQRDALETIQKYKRDMPHNISHGVNLICWGTRGTGKDLALVDVAKYAIGHGYTARFITGPNLFQLLRESFDGKRSERATLDPLIRADVLVLSDPVPPGATATAFAADALYRVVDERYRQRRPTLVSINADSGEDAEKRLGAALVDRLRDGAVTVPFQWPSFRRPANPQPPSHPVAPTEDTARPPPQPAAAAR